MSDVAMPVDWTVSRLGLVPRPQSVEPGEGRLTLSGRIAVFGPRDWVDLLAMLVGPGTGLRFDSCEPPGEATDDATVRLEADSTRPAGGYGLSVDETGVVLKSSDREGLLNGIQTLRQLMPSWTCGLAPLPGEEITLPHVEVTDAPRFRWRGVHLDVGRHFQPLASLFRFVDLLALHKINVFHLHLTEDQGWRFEVRKFPRLTQTGAVRAETRYPAWESGDGTPHGGCWMSFQARRYTSVVTRCHASPGAPASRPGDWRPSAGCLASTTSSGGSPIGCTIG